MTRPSCVALGELLIARCRRESSSLVLSFLHGQRGGCSQLVGEGSQRVHSSPSFRLCCEIQARPDGLVACLVCARARQSARGQPCWQPQPTHGSNLSPATHIPSPALGHRSHPVPAPELLRTSHSDLLSMAEKDSPEGRKAELLWQGKGKLNLPPSLF